ncbi:MAG TPA: 1,4-alpha-glucan branching protein GlgB [Thermoanaerobaculia bacterium]|jgi:1,4-alpha-glucan branching enzyme
MAVRRKKNTTEQPPEPPVKGRKAATSSKKAEPAKKAAPATKAAAPRKRAATPAEAVEELQNVGADVVPSEPVAVEIPAAAPLDASMFAPDATPAEAAPRQAAEPTPAPAPEPPREADPVVEPKAIREHRVDQITPQIEPVSESNQPASLLSDWDFHLFAEGTHYKLWEKLGSHVVPGGTMFGVWAPNAESVSVIGEFNGWSRDAHPLRAVGSGIWEGFIPGVGKGTHYKYHIVSRHNGYRVDKADPLGIHHETPPETASIVWDLDYEWNDDEWMRNRRARNAFDAPQSIYEVHLGSWRRVSDDGGQTWRSMTYREIAQPLAEYVKKMNFTHIELLPVMEHPFYGSWGYQCTGYFAPTSRHGTPQDFKYLVDVLHQHGIGVILDWVPSHFPTDEHGLSYFDGTHLFEHADPRKGFHPDWGSLIFNYGRNEVRSFLLSSALYWIGEFHADGLRVDAVASMLYLDYSRKAGEWIPNEFGGRENVEAISFLRRMNEDIYKVHPDVQVIAEESTAWPMVSRPTYIGGLGFGMKWDMGWMHDSLRYFSKDPIHRRYHHNDLTFRMMYAFTENFVLPLSHDEVVHGKGSLMGKMPGDEWQRAANLRLLYAHMYANPGKKLIFMGGDLGQYREWNHDGSLEWHLLEHPLHGGVNRWLEDLNKAYRDLPPLHELDMMPDGFEWIDCCDSENSVVTMMRRSKSGEVVIVALNYTPLPRINYRIGVPKGGHWREMLNSDAPFYGGSGQGNFGGVDAVPIPLHGRRWSVTLTIPPLGAIFLMAQNDGAEVALEATESSSTSEESIA